MKIKICLVFFLALVLGCTDDEFPVTLNFNQAERLLTAGSTKTWLSAESAAFPSCALGERIKFSLSKDKEKLHSFIITRGDAPCHKEGNREIAGYWKIDTVGATNRINFYAQDTSAYEIKLITASRLQLLGQEQEIISFTAP